jgi:hypothetical protein
MCFRIQLCIYLRGPGLFFTLLETIKIVLHNEYLYMMLEILNNLWGYYLRRNSGPLFYICWRNRFLGSLKIYKYGI